MSHSGTMWQMPGDPCTVGAAVPTKMTKRTGDATSEVCDIKHIQMTTEGLTKPMDQWNVLAAEHFFPDAGSRTICVPALYFNHQNLLTPDQAVKRKMIPTNSPFSAGSNLLSVSSASPSSSRSSSPSHGFLSASSSSQSLSALVPAEDRAEVGESEIGDPFIDTNTLQQSIKDRSEFSPVQQSDHSADTSEDHCQVASSAEASTRKATVSTVDIAFAKKTKPSALKSKQNEASSSTMNSRQPSKSELEKESKKKQTTPSLKRKHSVETTTNRDATFPLRSTESLDALSPKAGKKARNSQQHPQPVMLVCPSQESMMRRDKAMTIVLDSLQTLGKELESEEGGKGLFIISGVNYDNYLNRIPAHVLRECEGGYLGETRSTRGVLDILVLHPHVGLMLIQVKSVCGNTAEWQASDSEMVAALKSVVHKVKDKSHRLQDDLSRELLDQRPESRAAADSAKPFHVLALPFVPRQLYYKLLHEEPRVNDYYEVKVLCKEDFENAESLATSMTSSSEFMPFSGQPRLPGPVHLSPTRRSVLYEWWKRTFVHSEPRLSETKLKEIVGRICGIFSNFTVQPDTKCRSEGRTFGHAVSETAARNSSPWLTIPQYNVLQRHDRFLALSGPPGSGKSLLLTLKAVQWLEENSNHGNHHVALVNLSPAASSTQPHIRVLQEAIKVRRTWDSTGGSRGHLLRITLPLDKVSLEDLQYEVSKSIATLLKTIREAGTAEKVARKPSHAHALSNGLAQMVNGGCIVIGEEDKASRELEGVPEAQAVVDEADKLQPACVVGKVNADDSQEMLNITELRLPQENTNQHQSTGKLLFILNEVDLSDKKSVGVLQALRKHPSAHSVWWSTSEPPGTEDVWSLYEIEPLGHVTRRPPRVQHVLQNLERREQWKNAYASTSVESGLPTEGPPVIHIAHAEVLQRGINKYRVDFADCEQDIVERREGFSYQEPDHKARGDTSETLLSDKDDEEEEEITAPPVPKLAENIPVNHRQEHIATIGKEDDSEMLHTRQPFSNHEHSAFWCEPCAQEVADVISRLVTDSANPNPSPFFVGTTKFMKDPSKNKFGTAIKPRDILIVTNFPHKIIDGRQRTTDNQIHHFVQSTLVRRIREVVPLKILTEESGRKIAFPKNCAVLTDARNVRGLERKVVVYVPGSEEENSCLDADLSQVQAVNGFTAESNSTKNSRTKTLSAKNRGARENHTIMVETNQILNAEEMREEERYSAPTRSGSPFSSTKKSGTEEEDLWSNADSGYCGDLGECTIVNASFEFSSSSGDDLSAPEDAGDEPSMDQEPTADVSAPVPTLKISGVFRDDEDRTRADEKYQTEDQEYSSRVKDSLQCTTENGSFCKSEEQGQEEEQLPGWMREKKALVKRRNLLFQKENTKQVSPLQREENGVFADNGKRNSVKRASHSLVDVLSKLSDANKQGVYAAAACCLGQLVIMTE